MFDLELVKEILQRILGATRIVARRFASIASAEDLSRRQGWKNWMPSVCS
jgi:hypothetical protein